jgi:hypothetical protein
MSGLGIDLIGTGFKILAWNSGALGIYDELIIYEEGSSSKIRGYKASSSDHKTLLGTYSSYENAQYVMRLAAQAEQGVTFVMPTDNEVNEMRARDENEANN